MSVLELSMSVLEKSMSDLEVIYEDFGTKYERIGNTMRFLECQTTTAESYLTYINQN